jgi:radical SAM superfamily enzyme YgiQ (UPF0313 family)
MVGFPGETQETVSETIKLMLACLPDEYIISAFVPYPGTDPYQHPEQYGIETIEADFSQYFLLRKGRQTSYIFRTANLAPNSISEMRTRMIQELSPHISWAGSTVGYK